MSTVHSVERAFAVLQALATGAAGVSDIAERVDLPKSTVARLLATLVGVGAVDRTDSGGYALGELILDLSSAAAPGRNLIALARPYLAELVDELGEAAGLGVLDDGHVRYIDQVDGDHEVLVRDWTGESVAAHVVSSGLVLLASAPVAVRRAVLAGGLEPWTDHSVVDPAAVERRLAEVHRAGFAWVYEEMAEGLNSVAAPIVNPAGTVIAAVHVHGPSYRFPAVGEAASIAAAVVATGRRISDRLAGRDAVADESLHRAAPR